MIFFNIFTKKFFRKPILTLSMDKVRNIKDFFRMYVDGFKNMSKMSKTLWVIIFIKLFIMFAVIRAFLFPNFLNSVADSKEAKAEYVSNEITEGVN